MEGTGGICPHSCFGIESFHCSGAAVSETHLAFSKILGPKKMQHFFFVHLLTLTVDTSAHLDLALKQFCHLSREEETEDLFNNNAFTPMR